MTHSDIKWNKLDDFIEQSKEKVNAFKRLEEIENEKKELHKNEQILVDEENKIKEKYKQEYTKRLNDRLDDFGILTVVTGSDHDEGRIISVTKDEIKVRYWYNYGSSSADFTISTKELQEKGYVEEELYGRKVFIVDNIKNPLDVFEIIKYRLKVKAGEYKRELKWGEEEIEKGNERVKKAKEELEKYKKVSDGMITRTFNGISFGVTDLKIEDILKALPREICIYQEDKNKVDKEK